MKKILTLTVLCFLIISANFAQDDATKYAPTAEENALLWKIEGKELSDPSYLYGTIHMIPAKDFIMTDDTKKAFKTCDRVTFEINLEDMGDMGSQLSLMMGAFMNDGVTLKDLLEDEDYLIVKKHFDEQGLPLFMLERIKPMFLSIFASGDMDMMTGGFSGGEEGETPSDDAIMSYELEFMEMAKVAEKSIGGLETADYQMSMFDSIPYKAQADMLVESIKMEKVAADEEGDGQFDQMVEMYKRQDLQAMEAMLKTDEAGLGEYEDVLLANRNRNWIPIMQTQMQEMKTFFAVGAGHLGGEIGVIALLRQAGYTLTPVRTE